MCTQPRRVAAITLAEYVAKDRGQDTAVSGASFGGFSGLK